MPTAEVPPESRRAARRNPVHKGINGKILRPHTLQRGEAATQHVEATGKQARLVERPKVRHILHHAKGARVAPGVSADGARIDRVDIAADGAGFQRLADGLQCPQQRPQRCLPFLEQVKHRPAR